MDHESNMKNPNSWIKFKKTASKEKKGLSNYFFCSHYYGGLVCWRGFFPIFDALCPKMTMVYGL